MKNLYNEFHLIMNQFKTEFPPEIFKHRQVYANWLAQTYYFVSHSTSLLGLSLPYLKNSELRRRFEKHISEEIRHELVAKKDLENLGHRIEHFREFISTQAFYQGQYYRIQFEGAVSLLGYILFLEGMAVHWANLITDQIKDDYPESISFLKIHTDEDPHHLDEALNAIGKLTPSERTIILANLHYSSNMYNQMLQNILECKKQLKVA